MSIYIYVCIHVTYPYVCIYIYMYYCMYISIVQTIGNTMLHVYGGIYLFMCLATSMLGDLRFIAHLSAPWMPALSTSGANQTWQAGESPMNGG